ncbi:MAG: hypothetical protein KatS3mg124_0573 [Porticoccaceae bacterium]|nr:MAG: hypothetical protein KatS3mg124_0573 [Porticoccaceae bacterium]
MARKRRELGLSLSFLDIMACGFGAVTLLFLILRHQAVDAPPPEPSPEAALLGEDLAAAEAEGRELARRRAALEAQIAALRARLAAARPPRPEPAADLEALRRRVAELERQVAELEASPGGSRVRAFLGEGHRQYLTGLKLGGERVLILVDGSASMLADTVVNAVRLRNLPPERRRRADKWRWVVRSAEWLLAQLPPSSRFQLYVFDEEVHPAVAGSAGRWLDAADSLALERAAAGLAAFAPERGTRLLAAARAAAALSPPPDNLFLLTDGLPTLGEGPPRRPLVGGAERREFFRAAVGALPRAPVNVLLFPLEGDPEAAAWYWQLALDTGGAFLAPSRDWP